MAKRNCRRQLSFQDASVKCTLCNQVNCYLSTPSQWTNEKCRDYVTSVGVSLDSNICKPCRNDITKVLENENIVPRWQKATQICKQSECYIKTCKEIAKHNSNISSDTNFSNSLSAANLKLKYDEIPSSIPLCNQHYHVIYNLHQPTQTHYN